LTAMESLVLLGFTTNDPDITKGLGWFFDNQQKDGLWECSYGGKKISQSKDYPLERIWISLRICRMLKHFLN
jgi:hypothetical protein